MTFHSILFEGPDRETQRRTVEAPSFFGDLNLDQLVDKVTASWKEYDLAPFYYAGPETFETISYRQQVVQDLEDEVLLHTIKSFSEQMQTMRKRLDQSKQFYYKHASQRVFLGAVEIYCKAVERLTLDLCARGVGSPGLLKFRDYLAGYVSSLPIRALVAELESINADFAATKYCLLLKGDSITVRNPEGEADYSSAVEETFEKFRRNQGQSYRVDVREMEGVNHIQEQVLEGIARLNPETFEALDVFCKVHHDFVDEKIARFDREIQFYVSFLTYIERLRGTGLNFCRPKLSQTSKEIAVRNAFDLVLANKLVDDKAAVVCNDFSLSGPERILVISGPNHGGKTTFARMFAQMHYLASLGLPVPGTEARLFLFDRLFTHFERAENVTSLRGKLQDDLIRIRHILDQATPNSLIVLNEIFSSTALQDAIYLGQQIFARLSAIDLAGVCVTFLDELASFNEKTVSLVSTVNADNPAIRTFKLERRPADGLAYALAIAQKHRVTYELLVERIAG